MPGKRGRHLGFEGLRLNRSLSWLSQARYRDEECSCLYSGQHSDQRSVIVDSELPGQEFRVRADLAHR
jgi:hypothetical protein